MKNKNNISIVELALLAGGSYLAYKYLIANDGDAIPQPEKVQDHAAPVDVNNILSAQSKKVIPTSVEPIKSPAPPIRIDHEPVRYTMPVFSTPTPVEPIKSPAPPVKFDLHKFISDVHDILPAPSEKVITPVHIQDHAAPVNNNLFLNSISEANKAALRNIQIPSFHIPNFNF